jgi:hypothetical protein
MRIETLESVGSVVIANPEIVFYAPAPGQPVRRGWYLADVRDRPLAGPWATRAEAEDAAAGLRPLVPVVLLPPRPPRRSKRLPASQG